MSSLDYGVRVQFPEVSYLLQSLYLLVRVFSCDEIRISGALRNRVAEFFAAVTSLVLLGFHLSGNTFILEVFVFVVLRLVLTELAASVFFVLFTTAPPHLSAPISYVLRTTPVEVFFLVVLFAAVFASLESAVEFAFPADEFGYPGLHFTALVL